MRYVRFAEFRGMLTVSVSEVLLKCLSLQQIILHPRISDSLCMIKLLVIQFIFDKQN